MQVQSTISTQSVATIVSNSAKAVPQTKVAPEVVQLNRVNLKTLILKQDGKFVSVDYIKADGESRTLTGRLGVKSYLKGGQNKVESSERPYITMFDVQLRQYRTVNLSSMSELRASGKLYQIVD